MATLVSPTFGWILSFAFLGSVGSLAVAVSRSPLRSGNAWSRPTAEKTSETFSFLLGSVAGISLVGGIGILALMVISVRERTREIGVRRAVGARRQDILVQFVMDATTLSLVGRLLGTLVGVASGIALSHPTGWPIAVSPLAILLSFGVSAGPSGNTPDTRDLLHVRGDAAPVRPRQAAVIKPQDCDQAAPLAPWAEFARRFRRTSPRRLPGGLGAPFLRALAGGAQVATPAALREVCRDD